MAGESAGGAGEQRDGTGGEGHAHGGESHAHASVKTYVLIGLILTIITAVEVAIFYIPQLAPVLVPSLLVLTAGKFVLVVLFYMHLKFDHAIFSRVFYGPLFLAILIVISLILIFKVLPQFDAY